MLAPAILLILALVIAGGRIALASQAVAQAAAQRAALDQIGPVRGARKPEPSQGAADHTRDSCNSSAVSPPQVSESKRRTVQA